MKIDLPEAVNLYLAADAANDTQMLALCFADNALVHDERRDYRGLIAIQAWQQEAHSKYSYTREILSSSVEEQTVKVRARLTGDFPGSPAELDYTFTLADNKITSLDIRP